MKLATKAVAAAALAVALGAGQANAVPVKTEIQLLVDVSGSVDDDEFELQRDGYVAAFNNPAIQAAIAGLTGGVAVQLVYWSGAAQQQVAVPWTLITNATQAGDFATAIAGTTQPFLGLTAPGSAINFAVPLFDMNGFEGDLVIDVSGDGAQNDGASTPAARDAAALAGVAINGLAILTDDPNLDDWYNANVRTAGGFVLAASTFDQFEDAITTKIGREVGIPEPLTLTLFGLGLAGLGFATRRRR